MAITFGEIKQYLARNIRLSICFEDGHYHNYLIVSDIPEQKYDRLYVYGIGMVDVEFPKDIYANPQEADGGMMASRDDKLEPAIEILLHEESREIERSTDETLVFKDLKPYLQIGKHFSIVNKEDWSYETFEYRNDIPEKYDNMYVYGIGMEDNPYIEKLLKEREYDTYLKKRMVIVLSGKKRENVIRNAKASIYGNGPFFLLITAKEWNHDADEWLGIYVNKKEAGEAYDKAIAWYEEERKQSRFLNPQEVTIVEYIPEEDRFRSVERHELD